MKRFYMPIILSVWSLVILLVAGCVGKPQPSLDADSYYGRGRTYYEKGQYDQAISNYTQAVEINLGFADAYVGRGDAYFAIGQYDPSYL